jgi:hypothetical protein
MLITRNTAFDERQTEIDHILPQAIGDFGTDDLVLCTIEANRKKDGRSVYAAIMTSTRGGGMIREPLKAVMSVSRLKAALLCAAHERQRRAA